MWVTQMACGSVYGLSAVVNVTVRAKHKQNAHWRSLTWAAVWLWFPVRHLHTAVQPLANLRLLTYFHLLYTLYALWS